MRTVWTIIGLTALLGGGPCAAQKEKAMMSETKTQDKPMQGRIPLPTRDQMTAAQQQRHDSDPMAKLNLSRLLDTAPAMGQAVRDFNTVMARENALPPVEREIMTLAVLHLERGEYELAQHREVARAMGIADAKVAAIAQERYGDPIFTDRERALLAFTRQVVRAVRVDDAGYGAVAAFYQPRQIVEATIIIGNYMMLARVSEVAELPVDGSAGAAFWKKTP